MNTNTCLLLPNFFPLLFLFSLLLPVFGGMCADDCHNGGNWRSHCSDYNCMVHDIRGGGSAAQGAPPSSSEESSSSSAFFFCFLLLFIFFFSSVFCVLRGMLPPAFVKPVCRIGFPPQSLLGLSYLASGSPLSVLSSFRESVPPLATVRCVRREDYGGYWREQLYVAV